LPHDCGSCGRVAPVTSLVRSLAWAGRRRGPGLTRTLHRPRSGTARRSSWSVRMRWPAPMEPAAEAPARWHVVRKPSPARRPAGGSQEPARRDLSTLGPGSYIPARPQRLPAIGRHCTRLSGRWPNVQQSQFDPIINRPGTYILCIGRFVEMPASAAYRTRLTNRRRTGSYAGWRGVAVVRGLMMAVT